MGNHIRLSSLCTWVTHHGYFSFFTFKDVLFEPALRLKWLNVASVGLPFIYYYFFLERGRETTGGGTEGERQRKS